MGLTPLNGLPGATRSGAIDPSLIFHYTNKAGRISHDPNLATNLHVTEVHSIVLPYLSPIHPTQAEDILNCKSGWKALTGTTDFRLITERAQLSSPSSDSPDRLAFDLFVDRILNYVGSYYLKLGGAVDALVFAGMIGEKSKELREAVARHVVCLGFVELDQGKNVGVDGVEGTVVDVGVQGDQKQKRLLVCRTDEQVAGVFNLRYSLLMFYFASLRWRALVCRMMRSGKKSSLNVQYGQAIALPFRGC